MRCLQCKPIIVIQRNNKGKNTMSRSREEGMVIPPEDIKESFEWKVLVHKEKLPSYWENSLPCRKLNFLTLFYN